LDAWKVLEYVFLKNRLWMLYNEAVFRKERTGYWPPRVDKTFLSIKEMAWFFQFERDPAGPRSVFVNGIKPNFDVLPEKLRWFSTRYQREGDQVHQADADM
jgi:hypothetical protein